MRWAYLSYAVLVAVCHQHLMSDVMKAGVNAIRARIEANGLYVPAGAVLSLQILVEEDWGGAHVADTALGRPN